MIYYTVKLYLETGGATRIEVEADNPEADNLEEVEQLALLKHLETMFWREPLKPRGHLSPSQRSNQNDLHSETLP